MECRILFGTREANATLPFPSQWVIFHMVIPEYNCRHSTSHHVKTREALRAARIFVAVFAPRE